MWITYVNEFEASSDKIIRIKKVPVGDNIIVKVIKKRKPFNHMAVCLGKNILLMLVDIWIFPYMEDYYLMAQALNKKYNLVNPILS